MNEEQKMAFNRFKNAHFKAVQTDTELGISDGEKFFRLERTAKKFWAECREAEEKFLATFHD